MPPMSDMSEISPADLRSDNPRSQPSTDVRDSAAPAPRPTASPSPSEGSSPSHTKSVSHRLPLAVLLVGAAVTVLLTWAAASANTNSDHRLLKLQVRQAATALSTALPSIQTPLTAAFDVAAATQGTAAFQQLISPDVGPKAQFLSASLWQISPGSAKPLIVVGVEPVLATTGEAASFFSHVQPGQPLSVTPIIGGATPRLGFAEIPPGHGDTLLVYAETPLPADKKATIPKSSAFSDLHFALYLGRRVRAATLIERAGPLQGYRAQTSVPFGDTMLTIVGTTTVPLAGGASADLPLIAAIFGAILTLGAAANSEYLVRRRRLAEVLAAENASLYVEQRTISEALQHSLLPDAIPALPGIEIAVRYLAGVGGIDVGGDWYDVIPTGDGNTLFVVGDVSGRGLGAATTMGYLRHAIRAYAAQGGGPAAVLDKLGDLVGQAGDGHFATVVCGYIDVQRRLLTVASSGHFSPLVKEQGGTNFVELEIGLPIGVLPRAPVTETTVTLSPGATVVAFTDGLVERRGEQLDVGLDRLRDAVGATPLDENADQLLGTLLADLAPGGSDDDIAILGVRWLN
jgi:serine phosphatase RsbU (regulator of sigma subunit)